MRKIIFATIFPVLFFFLPSNAQQGSDTTAYLITCGSGTETYSVYGHSALRVFIRSAKSDIVYNWGVFDFDTPWFAWKFAKGKLDYLLDTDALQSFLREYVHEKRYVLSQKINLSPDETAKLLALINENLKPENIKYRYDFFYDDCSTRIRDLIEKSLGKILLYPPEERHSGTTFRKLVGKYQAPFPWYKLGVDLIMGSSGDREANFRERMFLPEGLKSGLSDAVISRDGKMIPLLQNPVTILDYPVPTVKSNFLTSPAFVFTLFLVVIILITTFIRKKLLIKVIDITIFSVFSLLAVLMIFFNFFTDHAQMRMNLNIIWLNPFIIVCLAGIILKKKWTGMFRILFFISLIFVVLFYLLPQQFNASLLPLIVLLLVRSSARSGFEWNPLSINLLE